jgi:hypothetical protein
MRARDVEAISVYLTRRQGRRCDAETGSRVADSTLVRGYVIPASRILDCMC